MNRTIANQTTLETSREGGEEYRLIQHARRGDLAAFNALVLAYQDSLYRWVLSLVAEEAVADDLTQASFITAYEKLASYRGGSFRAWLFTIARNRAIDELRRLKRHPSLSLDTPRDEDELELASRIADPAPSPEAALLASERAEFIESLLRRLPVEFQQVLRLIDIEEFDYQEAAEALHLPLGTVKSRLARARLRMRDWLPEN